MIFENLCFELERSCLLSPSQMVSSSRTFLLVFPFPNGRLLRLSQMGASPSRRMSAARILLGEAPFMDKQQKEQPSNSTFASMYGSHGSERQRKGYVT